MHKNSNFIFEQKILHLAHCDILLKYSFGKLSIIEKAFLLFNKHEEGRILVSTNPDAGYHLLTNSYCSR